MHVSVDMNHFFKFTFNHCEWLCFMWFMCNCLCSLGKEVPWGYASEALHGFIEELVVNDDPEYQVR